jgi:hypothetical protein
MAMIKGENKVGKLKKMLHKLKMMMVYPFNLNKCLIQEFIKAFNKIILLIIYPWKYSKRGNYSFTFSNFYWTLLICFLFGTSHGR